MMRRLVRQSSATLFVVAGLLAASAESARAQDTTRGVRIGLVYTPGTRPGLLLLPVNGEQGDSVRAMLQRDLDFSDRITVIAPDSTFADGAGTDSRGQFNYGLYSKLGAAVMLQATVTGAGLHVAVHNVAQQKVERVKDFVLESAALSPDWRLSLHAVSDEVQLWVTGTRGIAATRILYVDTRAGGRVWRIDSDGANPTPLTGPVAAMSPVWHPKATHIAYATMTDAGARIFLREEGGAIRGLTGGPGGQNSSPAFSPDGGTLAFAHLSDNGTDVYATTAFASEQARRVTVGRGIFDNTGPTFSPDGKHIAFTSNKLRHPEVYIADADGTNAEPLTTPDFGDQSYRSDPDWSPDGSLIAFQSQFSGNFQVMTISLRDRSMKRHTSEGVNENASFAPDSRHIVFNSDRTGVRQLFVIDTESGRVRQLTHESSGARQPAWSPLLRGVNR